MLDRMLRVVSVRCCITYATATCAQLPRHRHALECTQLATHLLGAVRSWCPSVWSMATARLSTVWHWQLPACPIPPIPALSPRRAAQRCVPQELRMKAVLWRTVLRSWHFTIRRSTRLTRHQICLCNAASMRLPRTPSRTIRFASHGRVVLAVGSPG